MKLIKIVASSDYRPNASLIKELKRIASDILLNKYDDPNYYKQAFSYFSANNINVNINYDDHYNWVACGMYVKMPVALAIKTNLAYRDSLLDESAIEQFVKDKGLSSKIITVPIFWTNISHADTLSNNDINLRIEEEAKDENSYDFGNFGGLLDETEAYIKYYKSKASKTKKKKSNDWALKTSELQSEVEDGINSIYEQTDAGSYIEQISLQVEKSLHIYSEPSIQGGVGSIIFYDDKTGDELLEKDYEDFCDDLIDMALESSSRTEFVSKLKQYYDI